MNPAGGPEARSHQEIATKNLEIAYKENFDEKELIGEKEKLNMVANAVKNLLNDSDEDIVHETKIALSNELLDLPKEDQGKIIELLNLDLVTRIEIQNLIEPMVLNMNSKGELENRIKNGDKIANFVVTTKDIPELQKEAKTESQKKEVTVLAEKVDRNNFIEKVESDYESSKYFEYFGIKNENTQLLLTASENLSESGLRFSFEDTLGKYKNFIETELGGLDPIFIKNIKINIANRFNEITDLELPEGENRFILNERISRDLKTDKIRQILEAAKFVKDYQTGLYENKGLRKTRTNYKTDPDGKMIPMGVESYTDYPLENTYNRMKSFLSEVGNDSFPTAFGEASISAQIDGALQEVGGEKRAVSLPEITFLNKKDQEVEGKAMLWYLASIVPQLIPGIGDALSLGVDGPDIFKKEHTTLEYLKKGGLIPQDYQLDKHWYDHALAGVGIVGSLFSLNEVSKIPRIAQITSKLSKIPLDVITKIAKADPKLEKAFDLFRAFSRMNSPEAQKLEKTMGELKQKSIKSIPQNMPNSRESSAIKNTNSEEKITKIIQRNDEWFLENKIGSEFLQNPQEIKWFKPIMKYATEKGDVLGEVSYNPKTKTVSYQINKSAKNKETGQYEKVFHGNGLTQNIFLNSVAQLKEKGLEVKYFEANWMSLGEGNTTTNLNIFTQALEKNPDRVAAALITPSGKAFERAFGKPKTVAVEEISKGDTFRVLFEIMD